MDIDGRKRQSRDVDMSRDDSDCDIGSNPRKTVKMEKSVDSDRFSRQRAAFGLDAMKKMLESSVLIVGAKGIGIEIAKDVVLAGVNRLSLYDEDSLSIANLGSLFFGDESDIGSVCSDLSVPKLKELNAQVDIDSIHGELTEDVVSEFDCVVLTNTLFSEQLRISKICRKSGSKLIVVDSCGLFARAFCDFGESHTVTDVNGEEPRSTMISLITQEEGKPSIVATVEDNRHGFESGDFVKFEEVGGMDALNDAPPMEISVISPFSFSIQDVSNMGKYTRGGVVTQVKMPKKFSFKPLEMSYKEPEFFITDYAKFDRPVLLHTFFAALHAFRNKFDRRFPQPGNEGDFALLFEELKSVISPPSPLSEFAKNVDCNSDETKRLLRWFSYGSSAVLSPMAAFMGGIVAQEILKAISGKYSPIHQWMYFDAVECLPHSPLPNLSDYAPQNSRYDDQIAVFGTTFQKKLNGGSAFLVGAGAIGCEVLKNWAMMGFGCSPSLNGKPNIHVTDMDIIETSNLSRQFLFRSWNIGQFKSKIAAASAKRMNKQMNIADYNLRVGTENESFFNDEFYESLNLVCNALDNVEARLYMDRQCIEHRLPLLESGTLGTKANTQVIYPHLTQSFGSSSDPPEESIPICTLKNFPNKIEHTIQWGRDLFEGEFALAPRDAISYLKKDDFVSSQKSSVMTLTTAMKRIHGTLDEQKLCQNFKDCVKYARFQFQELFYNTIAQLLHNFPPDMIRSSGDPFWSGTKRAPHPLDFNAKDPLHMEFIKSSAILRSNVYGIVPGGDEVSEERIRALLDDIAVPEFLPKSGVKIVENDSNGGDNGGDDEFGGDEGDDVDIDELISRLPARDLPVFAGLSSRMAELKFEKDDDMNYHIDFITAASNLRAMNYDISPIDKFKTKIIAGKIIPALITTTAVVCGLVCLEQYKMIQFAQHPDVEKFKNAFLNLALPYIDFSEPIGPQKLKMTDAIEWTLWDRIDIDHDLTIGELIDMFQEKYGMELAIISVGKTLIYNEYMYMMKKQLKDQKRALTITQAVEAISPEGIPAHAKYLTLTAVPDEDDIDVMPIRVKIRQ